MDEHYQHGSLRVAYRPVSFRPTVEAAIAAMAGQRQPAVLDSARVDADGRYTILACDPADVLTVDAAGPDPFEAIRDRLAKTHMLDPDADDALPPIFAGGWIGYFAYEAGRFIEQLPAATTPDLGLPVARFALYDSAAVYDHLTGHWTVAATDFGANSATDARPDLPKRLDRWESLLERATTQSEPQVEDPMRRTQARGRNSPVACEAVGAHCSGGMGKRISACPWPSQTVPTGKPPAMQAQVCPCHPSPATDQNELVAYALGYEIGNATVHHNISRTQFLRMVERAREYIAAGDIFQVNLARRETIAAVQSPIDLYLQLRRANPGAYAAYLSWQSGKTGRAADDTAVADDETAEAADETTAADDCAILSSSPELFLRTDGREVITRPIKGTRPRSASPSEDDSLRAELAVSPKDRAELAMIVDLERNDLGRVCEYGSVRVVPSDSIAAPYAIEAHPTVHHLVATVAGRLADGRDVIDLLRASFPGGSITGAPKVRAMQIIDELEPTERSVYTGCIGYFAPGGRMTMNIAIRTMIQAGGKLHWYAGGGMVADSDPAAEYDETCAKALGMRKALGIGE